MNSTLTFRKALPGDASACVLMRGKTRQNAISPERLAELGITVVSWAAQIESGQLPGHVCLDDDVLVGYCFGDIGTGEVVVLALLPAAEGQGLGKLLLERVMQDLRARGHRRLFLGCSNDPESRSHGFYRHLGWRATGHADSHGDEELEYLFDRTSGPA
nr:GNAT family N-acetyltransferase [uncultured Roseateles sp.]